MAREQIAALVDEVIRRLAQQGVIPAAGAGVAAPGAAAGSAGGLAGAVTSAPLAAGAGAPGGPGAPGASGGPVRVNPQGIYATLDEAVAAAHAVQAQLMALSLEQRQAILAAMREAAVENARRLAELAVRETGLGRVEHKVIKNEVAARKTPGIEDLVTVAWSGDCGLTVVERAPWGVIGVITPITNPTATVINNAISLVAGGNVPVFCFHPGARAASTAALEVLNAAIARAGGPPGLLSCVAEPSIEVAQQLMRHPRVPAPLVTGGGAVVREALASGKKVWAAGPGNPPTVVDATADLDKAARDIVDGASFDNNVLCTGEKECFVVAAVADTLKERMVRHGAFEVKWSEVDRLQRCLLPDGHVNKRLVGKDAAVILREAGIAFAGEPRLIICEVGRDHPFVHTEMLLPVLPIVRCKDVDEAIDLAIQAEWPRRHTASIHSSDIRPMSRMAREWGGAIFVKNGPHYAGFGVGGEGYCTLSIAGTTGEGLTSARTFTRERRCVLVGHFRIV